MIAEQIRGGCLQRPYPPPLRSGGDDDRRRSVAASADVLWLKAQLLKRWEAERKAQRPLDAMEPVQIGLGLVAAVVLMAWSVPTLVRSFSFL